MVKHPEEKHPEEKHPEKHQPKTPPPPPPVVKYERAPPKEGTVRVHMQKLTDEVNHGTTSYPVGDDGIVDLPPEAAAHVIRQGGAVQIYPPAPDPRAAEGDIKIKHVSDPATIVAHGDNSYTPGSGGNITVPLAIWPEVEPHGFVLVTE